MSKQTGTASNPATTSGRKGASLPSPNRIGRQAIQRRLLAASIAALLIGGPWLSASAAVIDFDDMAAGDTVSVISADGIDVSFSSSVQGLGLQLVVSNVQETTSTPNYLGVDDTFADAFLPSDAISLQFSAPIEELFVSFITTAGIGAAMLELQTPFGSVTNGAVPDSTLPSGDEVYRLGFTSATPFSTVDLVATGAGLFAFNLDDIEFQPHAVIVAVTISATQDATEGGQNGVFTVTRSGSTTGDLMVNYSVDPASTATSGTDYTALISPVTIPDGQASATIDVIAFDDGEVEVDETVIVNLDPGTGYDVGASPADTAMVNITSGNAVAVTISATRDAAEGGENGVFTVTRSGSTTGDLMVNYSIDPTSTATSGTDYSALTSPVTIPDGQASATIDVIAVDDDEIEADETVIVNLDPGTGYDVGASPADTATVNIASDEPTPSTPVPTLSGWALTALTLLLGLFGFNALDRRFS